MQNQNVNIKRKYSKSISKEKAQNVFFIRTLIKMLFPAKYFLFIHISIWNSPSQTILTAADSKCTFES